MTRYQLGKAEDAVGLKFLVYDFNYEHIMKSWLYYTSL